MKHGRTPGIGTVGSVVTSSGRRAQGSSPGRGRSLPTIGLGCHAAMAATPALAGFEVGYLSQDGVEHRAKTRLVSEAARKRAGAAS